MKAVDRSVARAESDATAARKDFNRTLAELRYRLSPRTVATETSNAAVVRALRIVSVADATLKKRPYLSVGGLFSLAAAIALRFFLSGREGKAERNEKTKPDAEAKR